MINTINLPPFKKMCVTIGNLPSSFMESMSYYETLCWLYEYLDKTVIPAINTEGEAITELQNAFVILKNYVDNYFDNLDVQNEINNKLDEMAEAGTLQEIISEYLNSTAIFGYDTVSDMIEASNLIDGSFAKTLGYYEKNDGGSALYKIRTITNEDVVDNKLIIAMEDDSLIAELITDNTINICQVGGQQNFANVFNYLIGLNKSIYIPNRDFTVADTLVVNVDSTQITCDGNLELTAENSTLISIQSQKNVIRFNGTLTCPTNSVCVEVCGGNHQVRASNIFIHYISQSKIGILINPSGNIGCQVCQFTFDRINANEAGIKFLCGDGTPWVNGNVFNGGQLHAPYGVVTRKGTSQTDRFNQNAFNNIVFTGSIQIALDLQFMEKDYFNEIRMSEGHAGTYWVQLDNCRFVTIENFSYIDVAKINILNPQGLSYPNYFKGAYIRDASDHWLSSECFEINGKFILTPGTIFNDTISSLEAAANTNTFTYPAIYNNNMIVKIGGTDANLDLTFTLPDIIERRGVTEFYLLVTAKDTTSKFTINDGSNTTRLVLNTGTALTNKLYYVKIAGKNMGNSVAPNWKVTEVNLVNI